jgi:hypothetical protein
LKLLRAIVGVLLIFDAIDTVVWVTRVLPGAAALDPLALLLVVARAITGGVEAMAAWQLLRGGPAARPLALLAAASAATLTTLVVGLGLAPSNVMPGMRIDVVAWYWLVFVVVLGILKRGERGERGDRI